MTNTPDTPDQVDALDAQAEAIVTSWEQAVLHHKDGWSHNETVAKLSALLLDARIDELTSVHSNEHEYGEAESRKMMYDRIKDLEKQREAL